jgi:acetyl-CoA acyltransferase
MSKLQEAYIVGAVRTPVGKAPKGVFKNTRPDDLLSFSLSELMKKVPQINVADVEDVIIGCAMPEGSQGMNVARIAALMAGFPNNVPAQTVNRFCSSGLQTIALARDKIALGEADIIVAGGVESMSQVPMGGFNYRANPHWFDVPEQVAISYGMGITAEMVADKWQIGREQQDEFAVKSHENALKAQSEGYFDEEIIPFSVEHNGFDLHKREIIKQSLMVEQDQGPRKGTTIDRLSKLRSVFKAKGTVTAGNTSQMSDGAAALLIVSEKIVSKYDLQPLARFKGFQVAGVAPEHMGIGPVAAIPKVLKQTGLSLNDISWIELNEAFAAQALAVVKELDIDPLKVNPHGGAIALGHPLGATGAIRACTLIHGMRKQNMQYGMVTMCIGTGMGAAGIFEIL